jgi:hypothetical protein
MSAKAPCQLSVEHQSFQSLPPLDPEEFGFLVQVGSAAAALRTPVENPQQYGGSFINRDGVSICFRFTDRPINRFMLAVQEQLGADSEKLTAVGVRFLALQTILEKKACHRWVESDPEHPWATVVHPAVIDAAATMQLNTRGEFPQRQFFRHVAELAHTRYAGRYGAFVMR